MPHNNDWILESVDTHLRLSSETLQYTREACTDAIIAAAMLIADTFRRGGKLLLCGNGGSAADCQHFAAEFMSRLTKDYPRPALPAIALTTDSSFLTAFSNDITFDDVFARQVEALGTVGDLLIGISTSGGSTNVVRAMEAAHHQGLRTIALMGSSGQMATLANIAITVPSSQTQYIQEAHLAIEHILCHIAEREIFGVELIGTT